MTTENTLKVSETMHDIVGRVKSKQEEIIRRLEELECCHLIPLYSSVDIRDSGFKAAVVDTNLFPAGFNNLCEHGIEDSIKFIRQAILKRVSTAKNILIVAEEHTRNQWYLEHVRILQEIIEKAGFSARIATFLSVQPAFCDSAKYVELETATKQSVKVYCFKRILSEYEAGRDSFDLIIMNNDLTTGIPEILKNSRVPIYPSLQAGWHARQKSQHFQLANDLIAEFARVIDVDPWLFSCIYDAADGININEEADRMKLKDMADKLFTKIEKKYKEHNIKGKPYIVLKSDSGTYGLGVQAIEESGDILTLNRKSRNDLAKGKNAQAVERYLLQEGVPTIYYTEQDVSEVVIYQIEKNLVGGFYRTNTQKNSRENLNSPGMGFKKMCPHLKKYGDCGIHHDINVFDVYRYLARLAAIAASREIVQLEAAQK